MTATLTKQLALSVYEEVGIDDIHPRLAYALIERVGSPDSEHTVGQIVVPTTSLVHDIAVVIKVGPGYPDDDGKDVEDLKPGQLVLVTQKPPPDRSTGKRQVRELRVGDRTVEIVPAETIFAIVGTVNTETSNEG